MAIEIVEMTPVHAGAVLQIYADGISTGQATLETEVPSWQRWDSSHLPFARLTALTDGEVAGWAALSPVSQRAVYRGVAEVSVYVSSARRGQGVGRMLLRNLVTASEASGIWTLQAAIFPENLASLALHEQSGFRQVGFRERIGALKGVWRNTILLERRSKLVGINSIE